MTLEATLDLHQAGERVWDVIVVGAGPAGSVAAREVGRRGFSVLLVDKATVPRFKVCGCCLSRRTLVALESLDLGSLVSQLGGIPLYRFRLVAGQRAAVIQLPEGAAISREAFDAALTREAIRAGVHFLPATRAQLAASTDAPDDARTVMLHQVDRQIVVSARLVIAADGLGGQFLASQRDFEASVDSRSHIGAAAIIHDATNYYESGTIFMACGSVGYVGLVRLEDGRLNIAAAFDPQFVKCSGGPHHAARKILDEAGLPPVPGSEAAHWRGTPLLTRRAYPPAAHRIFVLGDAAGYVEPFTGEGIAWAIASAAAIAPLAARACRQWSPPLAPQWSVTHRRTVARRQRACRVVAHVLRRPAIVRNLVAVLKHAPFLVSPLVHYLNGPPAGRSRHELRDSGNWNRSPAERLHANGSSRDRQTHLLPN